MARSSSARDRAAGQPTKPPLTTPARVAGLQRWSASPARTAGKWTLSTNPRWQGRTSSYPPWFRPPPASAKLATCQSQHLCASKGIGDQAAVHILHRYKLAESCSLPGKPPRGQPGHLRQASGKELLAQSSSAFWRYPQPFGPPGREPPMFGPAGRLLPSRGLSFCSPRLVSF